jgi:hypothetical protein
VLIVRLQTHISEHSHTYSVTQTYLLIYTCNHICECHKCRRLRTSASDRNLRFNQFSGLLPEAEGGLPVLNSLSLDNNKWHGFIPVSYTELPQLTYLSLYNNDITGVIPTAIGALQSLVYLHLFGNVLESSLPESMGNLTNLAWL